MTYNLPLRLSAASSPSSSLFETPQTGCLSLLSTSSTPLLTPRVSIKPFLSPLRATASHALNPTISPTGNGGDQGSVFKSIWVNPKSPRASQLREKSNATRYNYLIQLAEKLNSESEATPEFVNEALSILGDVVVEQDAVTILNELKCSGPALAALRFFRDKLKPGGREVRLYNVTMKVLRKCSDLESAEKLFDEMLDRGVRPDNVTFSTLITCARFCRMYNKAVEWFEKMPKFDCVPDNITYSAMIDVYGRAGNVNKALSLYDRARTENWRLDSLTFGTLIRMYRQTGNIDGCLNVYEEMKALKVKPNVAVYNTLLEGMGRAKRPWQVQNIYKEMTDNGLEPNRGTYAALLQAFCRARYGDAARKLYAEMKEKGFDFNKVLYNTMLSMCADLGFNDDAAEIFADMKRSGTCKPDSWTYSSMITLYACSNGQVEQAEAMLKEMLEAGFQPNIFILTSLIQCYGKANQIDSVVRTFNQVFELGITPDDRFCGSLLNVMTHVPNEDLGKLVSCLERANEKLGNVVKLLLMMSNEGGASSEFRESAMLLFGTISADVKKAYFNCLIDLSVNLNLLERACDLLELGLKLDIYKHVQARTSIQWSLNLKTMSLGAALTALHIWMNDLSRALESGEEFPPVLGINTGHGKHVYSENGLASVIESHLKELNSPFREASDRPGWLLTTDGATKTWLQSRKAPSHVVVSPS